MPVQQKVSTQAIVNMLLTWRGDVSAVARALGLSRNGLYQRITRLGLDLGGFRNAVPGRPVVPIIVDAAVPTVSTVPTASVASGARGRAQLIHKPGRDNWFGARDGRRLEPMQESTMRAADEVPIKTAPARRPAPLRLRPDLREGLQRAAWQLQAQYQVSTDESLILEQLVEETLGPWLASKLDAAKPAKKARKEGSE